MVLLGVDAALDDGQILPQLHDPGAVGLHHARADEVVGDHLGESALGVGGGGGLVGITHAPMRSQLRNAASGGAALRRRPGPVTGPPPQPAASTAASAGPARQPLRPSADAAQAISMTSLPRTCPPRSSV